MKLYVIFVGNVEGVNIGGIVINVLSLFDGISCGQVALERSGLHVERYYASEINAHAIQVTQKNYPNTIQLGDVRNVKGTNLSKIDILLGGSPCQGFSFAGKQLNFEDERSKLFFEYVRVLNETKPKYFLLENVKMKKDIKMLLVVIWGLSRLKSIPTSSLHKTEEDFTGQTSQIFLNLKIWG